MKNAPTFLIAGLFALAASIVSLTPVRASEDASGTVSFSTYGLYLSGETQILDTDSGSDFTITISESDLAYTAYGIYQDGDSSLTITKDAVSIDVTGSAYALNVAAVDLYDGLGDSLVIEGGDVSISATGTSADTSVYGLYVSDGNTVSITADSLSISASGVGAAYGIFMTSNIVKDYGEDEDAYLNTDVGRVTISADTEIVANGTPGDYGVIAPAICVTAGDLAINTEGSEHSTVIQGDVIVGMYNASAGYNFDAIVNIDFTGSESTLAGNAHVSESDLYDTELNLGFYDGATWVLQGSFGDTYAGYYFDEQDQRVTNLTLRGGVLDYTQTSDYTRVVVSESFEGSGSLLMKTNIAEDLADQLDVEGTASGEHTVYVINSGDTPTTTAMKTWLIRAAAGDSTFTLSNAGGVVETGVYTYSLATRDGDEGGTEWYLARNDDQKSQAGGTALALSGMASQYAITEALDSNLRQRLGELRRGVLSGLWARGFMQYDSLNGLGDVGFTQHISGLELGVDWRCELEKSALALGLRLQISHAWQDVDNYSGDGETLTRGLALYGTWFDNEGWFLDIVASVDWFNQDVDAIALDGSSIGGDYDTWGVGLSAEFGRTVSFDNGFFLEPKAKLRGYWIQGKDFTLSNGLEVDQEDTFFMTGRVGTLAGYKRELERGGTLQAYAKGGFVLPLSGYQKARIDGQDFSEDYRSETGAYYGIGFELEMSDSVKLYGEGTVQHSFNGNSNSRGVSVALSWLF